MPANTKPIFTLSGNFAPARIAAANTAADGSGTLVTLVTSGSDGTRVDGVRFRNSQASAALSTAMRHCVFLSDVNGTNYRLIGEALTGAATRSNTVLGATSIITFDQPVIMKSGQILAVCQSAYAGVQDQFDAIAYAGNY